MALTDEDFAAVPLGTPHSITIAQFVKQEEIDPIYYQRSYYLEPEELGMKPFALLLETLRDRGVAAVARFTLRHKERTCVLRPYQNTLALHVLFDQDEVRPSEVPSSQHDAPVDKESLELAKSYIEALSTDFLPEQHVDAYREAILTLIDEKAASLETKAATSPVQDGLPDLMAALQKPSRTFSRRKTGRPLLGNAPKLARVSDSPVALRLQQAPTP